jgi:hypothetical protein
MMGMHDVLGTVIESQTFIEQLRESNRANSNEAAQRFVFFEIEVPHLVPAGHDLLVR